MNMYPQFLHVVDRTTDTTQYEQQDTHSKLLTCKHCVYLIRSKSKCTDCAIKIVPSSLTPRYQLKHSLYRLPILPADFPYLKD